MQQWLEAAGGGGGGGGGTMTRTLQIAEESPRQSGGFSLTDD